MAMFVIFERILVFKFDAMHSDGGTRTQKSHRNETSATKIHDFSLFRCFLCKSLDSNRVRVALVSTICGASNMNRNQTICGSSKRKCVCVRASLDMKIRPKLRVNNRMKGMHERAEHFRFYSKLSNASTLKLYFLEEFARQQHRRRRWWRWKKTRPRRKKCN